MFVFLFPTFPWSFAMKNLIAAVVLLTLLPTSVFAGGGNKNATRLRVTNNSNGRVAVMVDNTGTSDAQLIALSQAQFTNQGGFILNGGESRTINVRAGQHTVRAAYIDANTGRVTDVSRIGRRTVNVNNNSTVNVGISGDSTGAATVQ
jgi:hypothetical protein